MNIDFWSISLERYTVIIVLFVTDVVIPVIHVPAEAWFHVKLGIPIYKCHPTVTQLLDIIATEEKQS